MGKASKPSWKTYRFDEMAIEVKDRVEVPRESGFDRYVGLEHLDSGSLKIWRWGSTEDVEKQKMLFKSGDIIFGRRNAYLRRVSVADFDGVCSAHAMVLRARPEVSLREFLPFFMQTEAFWQAALRNSAGSLSPTINWSNIAKEEFALPPLEEQWRIADALQASDTVGNKLHFAAQELRRTKTAMEIEVIAKPLGLSGSALHLKTAKPAGDWQLLTGQDLLDRGYVTALQDGNHGSQYPRASELGAEGIPYIAASDISDDGDIDLQRCKRVRPDRAARLRIAPAATGDVILTHNATVGRVTRLPEWPTEIVASTSTTYYRCDPDLLDPDYLRWFFESEVFQFQLATIMRQSTRNQVPITTQKGLLFAVPPLEQQRQLAGLRAQFLSARRAIRSRLASAKDLSAALLRSRL